MALETEAFWLAACHAVGRQQQVRRALRRLMTKQRSYASMTVQAHWRQRGLATVEQNLWIQRTLGVALQDGPRRGGGIGGRGKRKSRDVPNAPQPVQRFRIGEDQAKRAEKLLERMSLEEQKVITDIYEQLAPSEDLGEAGEEVNELRAIKKNYIDKALASDRSAEEIKDFFDRIKGWDKETIAENLHVVHGKKGKGIKQQWQMSCGPTTIQAFRAEMDPIYALKLRDENEQYTKSSMFSGTSVNPEMAREQKEILEGYKGVARPRGSPGGILGGDMAISEPLIKSANVKNYLGVETQEYDATKNSTETSCRVLAGKLKQGLPVPIRVEGMLGGHFALAVGCDGEWPDMRFSIHDPWDGKVVVVTSTQIAENKVGIAGCNKLTDLYLPKVMLDLDANKPESYWKRKEKQQQQRAQALQENL